MVRLKFTLLLGVASSSILQLSKTLVSTAGPAGIGKDSGIGSKLDKVTVGSSLSICSSFYAETYSYLDFCLFERVRRPDDGCLLIVLSLKALLV